MAARARTALSSAKPAAVVVVARTSGRERLTNTAAASMTPGPINRATPMASVKAPGGAAGRAGGGGGGGGDGGGAADRVGRGLCGAVGEGGGGGVDFGGVERAR